MKYLPPGTYEGVRCRGCDAVGTLRILGHGGGGVETMDHAPGCPYARKQPERVRRILAAVRRQEPNDAQVVSPGPTLASGALDGNNDSHRSGWFRVENKATETGKYIVTPRWWASFCRRSLTADEEPMLQVDFIGGGRTARLAVMRWEPWITETGVAATSVESPAKKNLHLKPADSMVRHVPWLEPAAVIVPLEFWAHKYPEPT